MAKHVGTQERVIGAVTLTGGMYRGNEMNGEYDMIAGYKAHKTPKTIGEQEYLGFVRVLEAEQDGGRKMTRVNVPAENVGYTVVLTPEPEATETAEAGEDAGEVETPEAEAGQAGEQEGE